MESDDVPREEVMLQASKTDDRSAQEVARAILGAEVQYVSHNPETAKTQTASFLDYTIKMIDACSDNNEKGMREQQRKFGNANFKRDAGELITALQKLANSQKLAEQEKRGGVREAYLPLSNGLNIISQLSRNLEGRKGGVGQEGQDAIDEQSASSPLFNQVTAIDPFIYHNMKALSEKLHFTFTKSNFERG